MDQIYRWLDQNNIIYTKHKHAAVYTVEQADEHTGHISGISAKTLLVFGEKTRKFYLVSLEGHKKLEQKKIKELLGERVRFADTNDLRRILSVQPGSVSPLGLIFDEAHEIQSYVIDKDILEAPIVTWHPNDNTQTLQFDQANMKKISKLFSHQIINY